MPTKRHFAKAAETRWKANARECWHMKNYRKIVWAYSGGLDTSIIIPWRKEHDAGCKVSCMCADVGQGTELEGVEQRAYRMAVPPTTPEAD